MIIDFHSHILPGIDDGSKDIHMSREILLKEMADKVDCIVATPHYYCTKQSIEDFIKKRDSAYRALINHIGDSDSYPGIRLGAEVYYNYFLNNMDNLHELCIEGTDYMLLELPYEKITDRIINGILDMADNHCINLVIAHVERYLKFTSFKSLVPLLESDVLCQINCGSIINSATIRNVSKMIKKGCVYALGTDVHNTSTRKACMSEGIEILSRKYSPAYVDEIMSCAGKILNNDDISDILR